MFLRLVGAAGSWALARPFPKLWRCGGCAGSGGTVWSSVRACGIALQVSGDAPCPQVPGGMARGCARRRSDVIGLRLGRAQLFLISASDSASLYLPLMEHLSGCRIAFIHLAIAGSRLKR